MHGTTSLPIVVTFKEFGDKQFLDGQSDVKQEDPKHQSLFLRSLFLLLCCVCSEASLVFKSHQDCGSDTM